METQQQSNKTIWQDQKALLVISIILFFTFNSCSITKKQTSKIDYVLLNQLLKEITLKNPKRILCLNVSNSNGYVVEIIKNYQKFDLLNNKSKLDSLKQNMGIKGEELNVIFNKNEYAFLISQDEKSEWDFSKINDSQIHQFEKNKRTANQIIINMSRPIYSSDKKFAIISISSTWSGIVIFKKEKKKWINYKLISPMFF